MPSLRDYRDRISSVKSTKKITSAMKMVAAAKLKKAQDQAEASQPYARAMAQMLSRVAAGVTAGTGLKLLVGTGRDEKYLLVVVTSDRGLAGAFNANLVRLAQQEITRLQGEGKQVKVVCAGRKARDLIKRTHKDAILESFTGITGGKTVDYADANAILEVVMREFDKGEVDVCQLIYNEFHSVLTQRPRSQQLIPFAQVEDSNANDNETQEEEGNEPASPYAFEPNEEEILSRLLPKNMGVQIFRALLDSSAGEQAARMTAMDNATRNAGERIKDLTLIYNRARQAYITKELIEIISGAEAV